VLLLLQLQNFYDTSVRAPLRDLGITSQASFGDAGLGRFPSLRTDRVAVAIEGLRSFCQEEPGNSSVLCKLGDADASVQEISSVVNRTQSVVRYRLMQVQEVLLAGQPVAGELHGLSEALRLFNTTQFVKNYLSQWRVVGNFSQPLAALQASRSELLTDVQQEAAQLSELKGQLVQAEQQRSELIDRLEEAIQGQSEKMAMGDSLQELQGIKRAEGLLQARMQALAAQEAETQQESQTLSALLQELPFAGDQFSQVSAHSLA